MDDSRILNAYDRGSADSYYGRKRNPHIKLEEGKKTFVMASMIMKNIMKKNYGIKGAKLKQIDYTTEWAEIARKAAQAFNKEK